MELDFKSLSRHAGHRIACVEYRHNDRVCNVSIECNDCNEVLIDFDNPEYWNNEEEMK